MAALGARLRNMRQAAAAIIRTSKQLEIASKIKEDKIAAEIMVSDGIFRPLLRQMLLTNFHASGLQNRSHTMERAIMGCNVDISPKNIFISMPGGIKYPESKKGDVYGAAGAFRYGAVRQPQTKTHYIDLPTGQTKRLKRGKGGQFGMVVKRAVKRVALKGGVLTDREARGRSGKAFDIYQYGSGISVIAPRPPFFELTDAQRKTLSDIRVENMRKILKANGMQVS